ncbi:MAG: aspartate-alanine antiporter [Prevotella sp.]|nr:aspartate-alanine antiporter [Bacteroides sp.]MCM1366646.1 aspartate-alanine antiporter [Prevotella sp.]MCM1437011.1 aspartate-alanine antiporter [Prevotella sp.]
MQWFVDILRQFPTLAIFLTLGLGFLIGKVRIGNFRLGSVTAVLIVGVIIGQMRISISGPVKMVFFMMFLFSIGYSVGPNFFKSLRGGGAKQALFAVVMSSVIFLTVWCGAMIMQYSSGETVGLFSGSQTCSALLGVGSEAISRMNIPQDSIKQQLDIVPVCYAVTYIFGTLGTVILLGNVGPKLLGGIEKVKEATAKFEIHLKNAEYKKDPAYENALRNVDYRSYKVTASYFATPRSVREVEKYLAYNGVMVYIDRIRHENRIFAPRHDNLIYAGDEIVACGSIEDIIKVEPFIGNEISDVKLLSYPLQRIGVVVNSHDFINKSIREIREIKYMNGVVIREAERNGKILDINLETTFQKGDHLVLLGRAVQVNRAGQHIGHVERPTISSDLMFVGLAIFIGGLFGALSFWVGSIPVSFGTSGGSLVAGLVFGWLRSKRPTYGNISPGALWLMNNLGLNVFIAVIGLEAAPSFVSGIKDVGALLFVVGGVCTIIPLLIGIWLGNKVFKFNPAITLGCCAGTRTCTAALGAVQDVLGSTTPAIGYTVTYAVSNILLVIWGMLVVILT